MSVKITVAWGERRSSKDVPVSNEGLQPVVAEKESYPDARSAEAGFGRSALLEPVPVFICRDAQDATKPCVYCQHCHKPRQRLMNDHMPSLRGVACWAYQAHRARASLSILGARR